MLLALLAAALVFYSLALSRGWLDREAPQLEARVPTRVPADQPFEVFVSSSEPVTFVLNLNGRVSEKVTQNLRLALPARPGKNALIVTATDGANNVTTARYTVTGVPEVAPRVQLTRAVTSGDALGVQVHFGASSRVEQVAVTFGETSLRTFRSGARAFAIGSVPLGTQTSTLPLIITLTDEFARVMRVNRSVNVYADPRDVELLELSPEVLSVSTPEGRELEERALAAAYAKGVPRPLWRAPFLFPTEGEGTSSFGDPRQYGVGGNISYHQGADIGAPEGTPIRATNAGIVRVSGFYPIKGGLVVIDHGGGVTSLYFHQSKIRAKTGQRVARGELIGWVGSTGLSTGPHLHWEMRVTKEATNPLRWVGKVVP